MKSSSFSWALDVLIGNRPTFHHQFCQVTVCILGFWQLQLMLLRTIASSRCSTIPGQHTPLFILAFYPLQHLFLYLVTLNSYCGTNYSEVVNSKFFSMCRASPSEFVIPLAKYYKAVCANQLSLGMRFRMMFETEESGTRRQFYISIAV